MDGLTQVGTEIHVRPSAVDSVYRRGDHVYVVVHRETPFGRDGTYLTTDWSLDQVRAALGLTVTQPA